MTRVAHAMVRVGCQKFLVDRSAARMAAGTTLGLRLDLQPTAARAERTRPLRHVMQLIACDPATCFGFSGDEYSPAAGILVPSVTNGIWYKIPRRPREPGAGRQT
jgi:hypothetical protein